MFFLGAIGRDETSEAPRMISPARRKARLPRGDFREAAPRQIAASYAGRGKKSVMSPLLFTVPPLSVVFSLDEEAEERRCTRNIADVDVTNRDNIDRAVPSAAPNKVAGGEKRAFP